MKSEDNFETLLNEALRRAGETEDKELMEAMMNTEEDELRNMTMAPRKSRWYQSVYFRAIAACLVLGIVIYGVSQVTIVTPNQSSYATLFNEYYHTPNIDLTTFDAGGDRLNQHNALNTKGVLERASHQIAQPSRKSTREGIKRLENLLQSKKYLPSLEHEIHWYLALGYIKVGQIDDAKTQLQKIPTSSYHKEEATQLFRKIK